MELWLRYREAQRLSYDERMSVASQAEWQRLIARREVISSVLWPSAPAFRLYGPSYRHRRHPHEVGYRNDSARNRSYLEACRRLAARLREVVGDAHTLVYAPLRGALPIWRVMLQFLPTAHIQVHFPVTSSFVSYAAALRNGPPPGRPASGRFTHVLEIRRLRPMLKTFDVLVYLDEIVSGGMMSGYVSQMLAEQVQKLVPIVACGLADDHGRRSVLHRGKLDRYVRDGGLAAFLWEGCDELITEDQRYLLGVHYVDNALGPHAVPMLTEDGAEYEEKQIFDRDTAAQEPTAH